MRKTFDLLVRVGLIGIVLLLNLIWPHHDSSLSGKDLYPVKQDGKWGFIDANGNLVISLRYEKAEQFSEGLAAVRLEGKAGYIGKQGNILIEPRFEEGDAFSEGMAVIRTGGRKGYIDRKGTIIIEPKYRDALPFSEERAFVRLEENGLWGLIDKRGRWVVEPMFALTDSEGPKEAMRFPRAIRLGAEQFDGPLVAVRGTDENTFGYMNKDGKIVWEPGK